MYSLICLEYVSYKFSISKPFCSFGGTMNIGNKIKNLRLQQSLTQEELANRCELSKGFISQLENDLTSPSIATLKDILLVLGTDLQEFFNEKETKQIVYKKRDVFVKQEEELKHNISWLIPNSQKNAMEPILFELAENGRTKDLHPHEGEIFAYVLTGRIELWLGTKKYRVSRGESFYLLRPRKVHHIVNAASKTSKFIWVSTPPVF